MCVRLRVRHICTHVKETCRSGALDKITKHDGTKIDSLFADLDDMMIKNNVRDYKHLLLFNSSSDFQCARHPNSNSQYCMLITYVCTYTSIIIIHHFTNFSHHHSSGSSSQPCDKKQLTESTLLQILQSSPASSYHATSYDSIVATV